MLPMVSLLALVSVGFLLHLGVMRQVKPASLASGLCLKLSRLVFGKPHFVFAATACNGAVRLHLHFDVRVFAAHQSL